VLASSTGCSDLKPCCSTAFESQSGKELLYKSLTAASSCGMLLCRLFTKADSCRADGWWHPYLKEVRCTVVMLQRLSLPGIHRLASRRQCSWLNACSRSTCASSALVPGSSVCALSCPGCSPTGWAAAVPHPGHLAVTHRHRLLRSAAEGVPRAGGCRSGNLVLAQVAPGRGLAGVLCRSLSWYQPFAPASSVVSYGHCTC
jgi:hypothetical protein